jgi:tetratricopeptide (TPR) repeat protein
MSLWSLKNKKVLIVEDFQEMRAMLRSILEPLTPALIQLAQNGEDGLELMENQSFDIVFCDYNLGKGKDGQQVLEEARHRRLISYATIYIMVTAENTSEMVMGAIDYMPDDYISKPFNRMVIQSRLKKIMDKKSNLIDISGAMADNDYNRALSLCDQLLAQKPANQMDILKARGEILQKLGRFDEASEFYEDIIEERDIPWAYMALARTRFLQEHYSETLEILEQLIRENPSNVAAYDLMAQTYERMGELNKAQNTLTTAVSKSPKSLSRQRHLAEIAVSNGDYEIAKSAYEHALAVGRHSCFKQADDYAELARTLVKTGNTDEAVKIANRIRGDFKDDPGAGMVAAITDSMVLTEKGDTEAAAKTLQSALELYRHEAGKLSVNSALALTGLCLSHNMADQADEITKHLVSNHHDDKVLLEKTKQVYSDAGRSDSGNDLVEKIKSEVVDLNNKGAQLLQEGRLEESIELFMKAANGMPDNVVVNLNTAYSVIMQMKKTGKVKKYMARARKYLERVHQLDPGNRKYPELLDMIRKISDQREAA